VGAMIARLSGAIALADLRSRGTWAAGARLPGWRPLPSSARRAWPSASPQRRWLAAADISPQQSTGARTEVEVGTIARSAADRRDHRLADPTQPMLANRAVQTATRSGPLWQGRQVNDRPQAGTGVDRSARPQGFRQT
jgi:hypothetical protein